MPKIGVQNISNGYCFVRAIFLAQNFSLVLVKNENE